MVHIKLKKTMVRQASVRPWRRAASQSREASVRKPRKQGAGTHQAVDGDRKGAERESRDGEVGRAPEESRVDERRVLAVILRDSFDTSRLDSKGISPEHKLPQLHTSKLAQITCRTSKIRCTHLGERASLALDSIVGENDRALLRLSRRSALLLVVLLQRTVGRHDLRMPERRGEKGRR